ncbi:hypothetical protein HYT23_05880 [Candidatus Pacearchaeota archaeon]|nr:hypothetical protein [Candidatus Pacearchaeota archaeon]
MVVKEVASKRGFFGINFSYTKLQKKQFTNHSYTYNVYNSKGLNFIQQLSPCFSKKLGEEIAERGYK